MTPPLLRIFVVGPLLTASFLSTHFLAVAVGEDRIDFNRDVRPILADNCFSCHGFDEAAREAGLRLDTRQGATGEPGEAGAIVPGEPDQSELILRIESDDVDLRMPPVDSHKKRLTPEAIGILRAWISQGAIWGKHWAFEPPVAAPIPDSSLHPIDHFVLERLRTERLEIAPRAADHTLARRLSFDLTGLPPSAASVTALTSQSNPTKWDRWMDELIDSPHFGERMAMWWLDGARYADTDGYQQDATRQNWPWRDWVVDAFNQNMPFDQFTIEQFAGDLLSDASDDQILATCFHRNHMHNGEGGRDPEESRVDYVLDRVNTMGTLWLGLTLGCTQCHDHKFDPISQRDYYSLSAYFNSIDEDGRAGGGAKPFLKYRSQHAPRAVEEADRLVAQTQAILDNVKSESEAAFSDAFEQMVRRARDNFQPWVHLVPESVRSTEGTQLTIESDAVIRAANDQRVQDDFHITVSDSGLQRIAGVKLEVFTDPAHSDGKYSYAESGEFVLTNVKLQVTRPDSRDLQEISLVRATASVDGEGKDKKYGKASGTLDDDPRTGWTTRTKSVEPVQVVVFELERPLVLAEHASLDVVLMQRSLAPRELIGRFRLSLTDQRGSAVRSLKPMPMELLAAAINSEPDSNRNSTPTVADIDAELKDKLHEQFLADYPPWQTANATHRLAVNQRNQAKRAAGDLNVTVLAQRADPRKTHVLVRGVWDQHGDEVVPGVLSAVRAREPDSVKTRLELAEWIVARENPLTARVIVNQVWQLFFGAGLVRTPNDFGLQGESPTHPDLLDWLAVDFMEHQWNLKHLVRRIVTSRTYQQESLVSGAMLERDPENRWLARGARFRLPSWMIRDAALKHSGLLNSAVGGPPMFAYQPQGVWQDQFMGRFTYQPSIGPAQYRRTLYTFWRRSSVPTFLFDSALRRSCEVVPRRTNTPLQALTLLNDTTALEAARALAEQHLAPQALADSTNSSPSDPLSPMFQAVLSRSPTEAELKILMREYQQARQYYESNPGQASRLVTVGQLPMPTGPTGRLAATMLAASTIMNMDESITHE